jgi:hypothetical protein
MRLLWMGKLEGCTAEGKEAPVRVCAWAAAALVLAVLWMAILPLIVLVELCIHAFALLVPPPPHERENLKETYFDRIARMEKVPKPRPPARTRAH